MDTPKSKPGVEFKKKGEGYDSSEVDEFVASARAEIADLQAKVRKSSSAGTGSDGADRLHDPDRAVERMLAAAQQTADRVVYEAEAEAERVLAEAEADSKKRVGGAEEIAKKRVSEAESQGERIRKEAVSEARRVVEETRQPLAREVKRLRDDRDSLRSEIETLRGLLSSHRERVRDASDALRELADNPEVFRVADPGPRTDVTANLDDDFTIEIPDAPAGQADGAITAGEQATGSPVAASTASSSTATPSSAPATPSPKAPQPATSATPSPAKAPAGPAPSAAPAAQPAPAEAATPMQAKPPVPPREPSPAPQRQPEPPPAQPKLGSVFSDAISDDAPAPAPIAPVAPSAKIVTLDDISREPTKAPSPGQPVGRVITGAFADEMDDNSDDALYKMGENASVDDGGFLSEVRKAASAEDEGGLGKVPEEEGEAISSFFEAAIDEPKSRFGRRNK